MNAATFLTSLPALLGLTGFVIYYLVRRGRGANQVTLKIVAKLRRTSPGRLPSGAEKFDTTTLAKLIDSDAGLRAQVDAQDFQLLRDALRQDFLSGLAVYGLCAVVFFGGLAFYVWSLSLPHAVSISSIGAESTDSRARDAAVDLDSLKIHWLSSGDPEDVSVALQAMDTTRQTVSRTVRSSDGSITIQPADYYDILTNRDHGGQNLLRVVVQSSKKAFYSPAFPMYVATRILAARMDARRIKIVAMIDDSPIPFYDFEAKLLLWGRQPGQKPAPITYGGNIHYGRNDIHLDPNVTYDFSSAKLLYFGPDDSRFVRTELFNFD